MMMDDVLGSYEGFDWDNGNRDKNLVRHDVQNWECEQVFFNQPLLVIEDTSHSISEKRRAAFGRTDADRLLVIIFTGRKHLLRVISARDMNLRERQYYEQQQSSDSEL